MVELTGPLNSLCNSGHGSQREVQNSEEECDLQEPTWQPAPFFSDSPFSVSRSYKHTVKSASSVIPLTDALLH